MLFNSLAFLIFFPVVTTVYFLLPHRWRWVHLLVASCVFYMAFIPVYIFILFVLIVTDYFAGLWIEDAPIRRKKICLIISIAANLSVLAIFKYVDFFSGSIQELLTRWNITTHELPLLHLILPVGLSFHTFQAMSYTLEVYRGKQKAEKHFGIYALYVMFYPQLAAGPIERPQHMLQQFRTPHYFNPDTITRGLRLMLWGMFMKVAIADRLAPYVNTLYNHPDRHNGTSLLLATFFFSFQLYCDFAGYSLIAIGSAKTMGFELMTNFKRPYFATSISEFWSRWHISLSTWFRDYVYIPLGGNRVPVPRLYLNLMIVFLLSGLWHGANWTFVVWGGISGIFLIAGLVLNKLFPSVTKEQKGITKVIVNTGRMVVVFIVMLFGWIFFRANTVTEGMEIVRKILTDHGPVFIPQGRAELIYSWLALSILLVTEFQEEFLANRISWMNNRHVAVRLATYVVLISMIVLLGVFDGGQFIYFQF